MGTFEDTAGAKLADLDLRVLCYEVNPDGTPRLVSDRLWRTNAMGQATAPEGVASCDRVAVLQPLSTVMGKDGRPAYVVYATSFKAGDSLPKLIGGSIKVRNNNRLVLFDVLASLEWTPTEGDGYREDLWAGLQQASAYLYDLTDGQMAFGPVTLETAGANWNMADIKVLAANDLRPTAFVGGIVPQPRLAQLASGTMTFQPAEVFLGRQWDGSHAMSGAWSAPEGFRTIGHEWGHYALFLFDTYRFISGEVASNGFCTCADLPSVDGSTTTGCVPNTPMGAASAMAYHYTASELWHPAASDDSGGCAASDHFRAYQKAEWGTLAEWSALQGGLEEWLTMPSSPDPGPTEPGVVGDLFGRQPGEPVCDSPGAGCPDHLPTVPPTAAAVEIVLTLALPPGFSIDDATLAGLAPEVYVVRTAEGKAPVAIYQGTTDQTRSIDGTTKVNAGKLTVVGVEPGSRIVAAAEVPSTPVGRRFTSVVEIADVAPSPITIELTPSEWRPSLDLEPIVAEEGLMALRVTMTPVVDGVTPQVRLVEPGLAADGAIVEDTMVTEGAVWRAILKRSDARPLPHHGIVWVESNLGDQMQWYMQGGVGPIDMPGHAPIRDGLLTADGVGGASGGAATVMYSAARDVSALDKIAEQGVLAMPALDLDIVRDGDLPSPPSSDGLPSTRPVKHTIVTQYLDEARLTAFRTVSAQLQLGAVQVHRGSAGSEISGVVTPTLSSDNLRLQRWAARMVKEDGVIGLVLRR